MAKFRFDHYIDIHWNGYDIVGDGGTIFSIPDQLYEEFESDLRPVEPSLEWTVVNEFLELQNSVSVVTLEAVAPIVVTPTSTGRSISLNANYSTTSHLHDGTYQPFGTYVTSVSGTAPITASGTTAITVGIDQSAITAGNASSAQATVYVVRNNTASTILKGTLVGATGAEPSGRIDIAPFSTTGLQDSELRVMGIATENIGVGVNGTVMSFGTLTGLDTRGTASSALAVGDEDWDEGTILYAHPTVPGKLTEVRPQHDLAIAFTTVRHASTGQIAIRIVPGNFHLEWLHDVSADSPSDGDIIQYKTSSSLWTKDSIAGAGIAASVHTHPYQDAGTYVTAVNGSAPIATSTDTAGIVSVSLSASYSSSTHTHSLPPTGSIVMWPTATAPTGWLFLDGATYSQATYPDLAAVFGVVSGTFTLPDMRDRFAAGASTISALSNNAGTFAPNTANSTQHDHATNIAHGHADTIAVNTHGDHTHTTNPAAFNSAVSGSSLTAGTGTVSASAQNHSHSVDVPATTSGAENQNLTHTVTGGVTSLGATSVTSNLGGNPLTPKSTLLNFIIKA